MLADPDAPTRPMPIVAPVAESLPEQIDLAQVRQAIELALRLGDHAGAWQAAQVVLRRYPEAILPMIAQGQALLEARNATLAVDYFRRALQSHPLDALAWAGLAAALSSSGQDRAGQAALRRAALHDPLGNEALPSHGVPDSLGMGIIYLRRGMAALAVAELAGILERHPNRNDLRCYYAEALRRNGQLEQARSELANLERSMGRSLPYMLLRIALHTDTPARERCLAMDPDGLLTRRFFAPERVPWELPPAPVLPWTAELDALAAYMPMVTMQAQAKHIARHTAINALTPLPVPETPPAPPDTRPTLAPEVREALAVAERMRHRLADAGVVPRPLATATSGQPQMQVILTSRRMLTERYGADAFRAIDRRLKALAVALHRRGVPTYCAYFDDPAALQLDRDLAFAPAAPDPASVRDLVRTMASGLEGRGQALGTLLLLGGDEVVPFHRLPNPIPDDDDVVLSDNPYASDDAGYVLPQRIVARIPNGADASPQLLLRQLDRMLEYHQTGTLRTAAAHEKSGLFGQMLSARRNQAQRYAGYAAEIWSEPSREVLNALHTEATLETSPPLTDATFTPGQFAGRRVIYLNLHGAAGLSGFYGQPNTIWPGAATRLPVALRPEQLVDLPLTGSLVLSEACYGAELAGRSVANSIPLRALFEGALAFVGATVNAYGTMTMPLAAADLLFQRMAIHLAHGLPLGVALHHARLEFAQTMYQRQGYLDDVDIKTLIEFLILGDPWALIARPSEQHNLWPASRTAAIERLPRTLPKAVLRERDIPRELLQRARDALRRILPGAAAAPLRIVAHTTPRQRKGQEAQDLVFSASETQPTADGHYVTRTAHVTLRNQAVVKVVMTR